jgi:hypothetical protein
MAVIWQTLVDYTFPDSGTVPLPSPPFYQDNDYLQWISADKILHQCVSDAGAMQSVELRYPFDPSNPAATTPSVPSRTQFTEITVIEVVGSGKRALSLENNVSWVTGARYELQIRWNWTTGDPNCWFVTKVDDGGDFITLTNPDTTDEEPFGPGDNDVWRFETIDPGDGTMVLNVILNGTTLATYVDATPIADATAANANKMRFILTAGTTIGDGTYYADLMLGIDGTPPPPTVVPTFRVFEQDIEVKVGAWGREDSFKVIKPFGGKSSTGAEV